MTNISFCLSGGALIGLAATGLMALNGRIAGISGIIAGLAGSPPDRRLANVAFMLGMMMIEPLCWATIGVRPSIGITQSSPLLIIGGLLVGFGTRMGRGCTSGHGVCGLARLSPLSLAAVVTFTLTAMATVTMMRILGQ